MAAPQNLPSYDLPEEPKDFENVNILAKELTAKLNDPSDLDSIDPGRIGYLLRALNQHSIFTYEVAWWSETDINDPKWQTDQLLSHLRLGQQTLTYTNKENLKASVEQREKLIFEKMMAEREYPQINPDYLTYLKQQKLNMAQVLTELENVTPASLAHTTNKTVQFAGVAADIGTENREIQLKNIASRLKLALANAKNLTPLDPNNLHPLRIGRLLRRFGQSTLINKNVPPANDDNEHNPDFIADELIDELVAEDPENIRKVGAILIPDLKEAEKKALSHAASEVYAALVEDLKRDAKLDKNLRLRLQKLLGVDVKEEAKNTAPTGNIKAHELIKLLEYGIEIGNAYELIEILSDIEYKGVLKVGLFQTKNGYETFQARTVDTLGRHLLEKLQQGTKLDFERKAKLLKLIDSSLKKEPIKKRPNESQKFTLGKDENPLENIDWLVEAVIKKLEQNEEIDKVLGEELEKELMTGLNFDEEINELKKEEANYLAKQINQALTAGEHLKPSIKVTLQIALGIDVKNGNHLVLAKSPSEIDENALKLIKLIATGIVLEDGVRTDLIAKLEPIEKTEKKKKDKKKKKKKH